MKVIAEVPDLFYYWSLLCLQSEINSADTFSTAKPDCSGMTSVCYSFGNIRNVTMKLVAMTILQYLDSLLSAQQRAPGSDGFSRVCSVVLNTLEPADTHHTKTERSERVDPSGATIINTPHSAAGTYTEKWKIVNERERETKRGSTSE